jgi:non-heme chloroperoxidase
MVDLHKMSTETDFRPELREISLPTMLIHGDNDMSTPIDTTARKTVPLIRGCHYGLPITHASQLNLDLGMFSKQVLLTNGPTTLLERSLKMLPETVRRDVK